MSDQPGNNLGDSDSWTIYPSRWYILFVVTFLNISGGLVWISLEHVANEAIEFYNLPSGDYVDLMCIFFFTTVVIFGFHAMMVLDKISLKFAIRLGATLLFTGCLIRAISTLNPIRSEKSRISYYITLLGQLIAGCGQPFIQFTPSKVAEHWFPENGRVLATTVIGMGTPIGMAIGSISPPFIVGREPENIALLTWLLMVPCTISLILALTISNSKPPSPPSSSAAVTSRRPFWPGIKYLLTNKAFIILLIYVGSIFGFMLTLMVVLEDILSAIGDEFTYVNCGTSACILVIGGTLGAILAAKLADKFKRQRITIMKLSVAMSTVVTIILFTIVHIHGLDRVTLARDYVPTLCFLVGFFGFMNYPLGLDLGVECAFPVSPEATCNGLMIMSGNLQGALYMVIILGLKSADFFGISGQQFPYFTSLVTMLFILTLIASAFMLLFFTEYNRMRSDVRNLFENAINTTLDQRTITNQIPSIYS
ncbi:Uncharacterized protein HDE_01223 [Halotydeus destructor]|nr:Uncharacterized protein HDE_01223 [Halotydeus destructor]